MIQLPLSSVTSHHQLGTSLQHMSFLVETISSPHPNSLKMCFQIRLHCLYEDKVSISLANNNLHFFLKED
jgi:hypothetical protein